MGWRPRAGVSTLRRRARVARPGGGGLGPRMVLSGSAKVCCVHDREKRQVTTEAQVAELGLLLRPPILFDPKQHKLFVCACCENLFFDISDEPRFCGPCQRPLVHQLGGPLPDPGGVVG